MPPSTGEARFASVQALATWPKLPAFIRRVLWLLTGGTRGRLRRAGVSTSQIDGLSNELLTGGGGGSLGGGGFAGGGGGLAQGFDSAHVVPEKHVSPPGIHSQRNSSTPTVVQAPPLRHGSAAHGSKFSWHVSPPKPAWQRQTGREPIVEHSPPLRHSESHGSGGGGGGGGGSGGGTSQSPPV